MFLSRKLKRDSMGNNNEVVITDTDRLLLQKDEEVTGFTNKNSSNNGLLRCKCMKLNFECKLVDYFSPLKKNLSYTLMYIG